MNKRIILKLAWLAVGIVVGALGQAALTGPGSAPAKQAVAGARATADVCPGAPLEIVEVSAAEQMDGALIEASDLELLYDAVTQSSTALGETVTSGSDMTDPYIMTLGNMVLTCYSELDGLSLDSSSTEGRKGWRVVMRYRRSVGEKSIEALRYCWFCEDGRHLAKYIDCPLIQNND